jgi:signal transduction histidine kinase
LAIGEWQSEHVARVLTRSEPRRRVGGAPAATTLLAWAGVLVCIVAVSIVATSVPSGQAFGRGLVELLIVGAPIATGVYVLKTSAYTRFGVALICIGFFWSVTALTESSQSVLFTIGRMATWLILPCAVFLLFVFPSGRITNRFDRFVFGGFVGVGLILFFGTAPFVEAFPRKTLWSTCTTDCPPNALFLLDHQPAALTQVILVREWLIELLWLGLFWSLSRRWRRASRVQRGAIAPVFVAGALLGIFQIAHVTYRQLGGPTNTVVALSSAWTLSIAGLCATFPLALFWHRRLLGHALTALAPDLGASGSREGVRTALATAFRDPELDVRFRDAESGAWCDVHGQPRGWPETLPAGRTATPLGAEGRAPELLLIHDAALSEEQPLLDRVAGLVLAVQRQERLQSVLEQALEDLEKSRRRIAEAADHERIRIERDLHDGAQQRLVALRIRLGHVAERVQADSPASWAELGELESLAELALEELRALAHGVYPARLVNFGVAAALQGLASQSAVPIRVAASGTSRYAMELESAVYFTCVEAVQNAMKHAAGATAIWVELTETPETLQFEVRDDGPGIQPSARAGQGLQNMHDRLEALSGRLTITAEPGGGTCVAGSVPVAKT